MRVLVPVALALTVVVHAATAQPRRTRPTVDVTGVFQSNYDEVRLEQRGSHITGTYVCCGGGTIEGRITGRVIHYRWSGGGGDGGLGVWTAISRHELVGTWGSGDSEEDGGEWNLTRVGSSQIAN
jgi:hypothetical protein